LRRATATVAALAAAGTLAASASATTASFSGSCKLSGPITPQPPITVVPRPGPHFDFHGTGTCGPSPAALTFRRASTVFDTCELGPDFPLRGTLTVGTAAYAVTVDLGRVALAGPFALTTGGGGLALGVASFNPGNPTTALLQCLSTGVATASLSAQFTTVRPLIGAHT
jgi:hypothetical protein